MFMCACVMYVYIHGKYARVCAYIEYACMNICVFAKHEISGEGAGGAYVNMRRLRGMHSTDATGPVCSLALTCPCATRSASRASLMLRQNCNMAGPSSDKIATNGLYNGPSCLCMCACIVCACGEILFVYLICICTHIQSCIEMKLVRLICPRA
jgi:hypothetical protein